MKRVLTITMLLSVCTASFAATEISADESADVQQLEARLIASENSCAKGGKAFAELFVPEGEYLSFTGKQYKGRNELVTAGSCETGRAGSSQKIFRFRSMLIGSVDNLSVRTVVVIPTLSSGAIQTSVIGGSFVDELSRTPAGWRVKSRIFHPNQRN